jgi:outer membrane lipoprotein-sorting protein
MPGQRTDQTINGLMSITLASVVIFAAACHQAGEPSINAKATAPATTSSSADFEGMIAMKMENEAQKGTEMTYFLKGKHTRIEMQVNDNPDGQAVMIWDLDGGKITTLMPARKMYMTTDLKQTVEGMRDAAKEMNKSRGAPEDEKFPKLTATGKQETIAGYTCEHWLMGDKQDLDICVAKGLGYFGMGGQSGGDMGGWKNLVFSPKMVAEAASHPEWVKFLEGGAFPLKMSVIEEGKVKMTMEATRIERKPLADALFSVPPDFKEFSVPSVPSIPAGRR